MCREKLLQRLVDSANFLSRYFRDSEDFGEGTGYLALTASDENTTRNDHILGLPFEGLRIIDYLEKIFGGIGDILLDAEPIAQSTDLFVSSQKRLVRLLARLLVLSTIQVTNTARASTCDLGLQLVPVKQGI